MKKAKKAIRLLTDIIYPRRCPVCDGILPLGGGYMHKECEDRLTRIGRQYCLKCGRQLKSETEAYCGYCRKERHEFEYSVAVYVYRKDMKDSIYRFKYGNRQEYAEYYGRQMAKAIAARPEMKKASLIVPVPLYSGKLRARGFNQAELLAREISARLHIPMDAALVERVRATTAQKELGAFERRKNLKKAFKIRQNDVKLDTVIVVDDIFTTGSTIDSVAQVLKEAGAKKVYAAALAVGAPK